MDHYFSDENLATDKHLNKLMRKEQNRPVKLSEICSWNNMRYYKFNTVVEAIKICNTIDVIEDLGEVYVKRKKPFIVADVPKAVKVRNDSHLLMKQVC
jgi:lupus La protein